LLPPPTAARRHGAVALSAVALLIASLYIGWLGLSGASASWEADVLLALRQPGDHAVGLGPAGTARAFRLVSVFGSYLWLAATAAATAIFLAATGRRRLALGVVCAVASAIVTVAALKLLAARPRPDVVPRLGGFSGASFPSSHAMLSMAVYGILAVVLTTSRAARHTACIAAVAFSLVIGFSRLYLAVHWPTDVLAGWCLGAAWALGFAWIAGAALARGSPVATGGPAGTRRDHAPPRGRG